MRVVAVVSSSLRERGSGHRSPANAPALLEVDAYLAGERLLISAVGAAIANVYFPVVLVAALVRDELLVGDMEERVLAEVGLRVCDNDERSELSETVAYLLRSHSQRQELLLLRDSLP